VIYKLKVSFSAALDCCEYAIIRGLPIFMYSRIVTNHQIKNSMTIYHCILCTDYSRAPTNLRIHGNTIFLQTGKVRRCENICPLNVAKIQCVGLFIHYCIVTKDVLFMCCSIILSINLNSWIPIFMV
jgi:hypothetical protein